MAIAKTLNIEVVYYNNNDIIAILNKIGNTLTNIIVKIVTVENAYIKINNLQGDKTNISLALGIYDKKDGNLIELDCYNFVPDILSTKNFITQGYEYVKTLDKYKDALDVLD